MLPTDLRGFGAPVFFLVGILGTLSVPNSVEWKCKVVVFPVCDSKLQADLSRLTYYQTTNFRLFQTERVCRQQFHMDENERKLSKRVENTVGKGEIARYEQFLLFPQCFQKACFPGASKGVIVWEGLIRFFFFFRQNIFVS